MKKHFNLLFLMCASLFVSQCGKKGIKENEERQINLTASQAVNKANTGCNLSSPEQALQWLSDVIKKAEEDRMTKKYMGNYMGKIFLTSYQSRPVIYIRMAMGSGGIYAYVYDCTGNTVSINDSEMISFEQQAQQGILIYSNIP
ncbi:MAG: hypothetical protein JST09_06805 [Bacteroidetes bacterium]|nr:hypothetical protein [Bacteroidota bacterium]